MARRPTKTDKEVHEVLDAEYNFESIIEPYREGGTEANPVTRTWGLVISWLLDKKKYPLEVIGAAIMLTIDKIKREGHFEGTGKHGSAGQQFDHNLLATCDMIQKNRLVDLTYKAIVQSRAPHMQMFITNQVYSLMPWWAKLFTLKYWKYRKAKKHGVTKRT